MRLTLGCTIWELNTRPSSEASQQIQIRQAASQQKRSSSMPSFSDGASTMHMLWLHPASQEMTASSPYTVSRKHWLDPKALQPRDWTKLGLYFLSDLSCKSQKAALLQPLRPGGSAMSFGSLPRNCCHLVSQPASMYMPTHR